MFSSKDNHINKSWSHKSRLLNSFYRTIYDSKVFLWNITWLIRCSPKDTAFQQSGQHPSTRCDLYQPFLPYQRLSQRRFFQSWGISNIINNSNHITLNTNTPNRVPNTTQATSPDITRHHIHIHVTLQHHVAHKTYTKLILPSHIHYTKHKH